MNSEAIFWKDSQNFDEQDELENLIRKTKQTIGISVEAEIDQLVSDGTIGKRVNQTISKQRKEREAER